MNGLPVAAGIAISRAFVAMIALFSIASGATVAKAQDSGLTWRQVQPLWTAAQQCIAQHPNDPSACKRDAERAWGAIGRLLPGEGPVLTLPALPRETACNPNYWAQRAAAADISQQNPASRQATTIAIKAVLGLYGCNTPPSPSATTALQPPEAPMLRQNQTSSTARPPRSPGKSSSPPAACEDGHWISEVAGDGSIVILEDDSKWLVDPVDQIDSALWLPTDSVVACNGMLIDTDDGSKVAARLLQ